MNATPLFHAIHLLEKVLKNKLPPCVKLWDPSEMNAKVADYPILGFLKTNWVKKNKQQKKAAHFRTAFFVCAIWIFLCLQENQLCNNINRQ